ERADVKKIARASAACWPAPRISAQATAPPRGAYTRPAMPQATASTVGTMSVTCERIRCAATGTIRETARLPTPVRASRSPAHAALSPRLRRMLGSQDRVAEDTRDWL